MWRHNSKEWHFKYFLVLVTAIVSAQSSVEVSCPVLPVERLHQDAHQHDIALIFYHVSWSNDSRTALAVYKQLAEKYTEYISFSQVDCFEAACNCTGIYRDLNGNLMSPYRWPTLIVHFSKQRMLRYVGEWFYLDMAAFLDTLLQPVQRVSTAGDMTRLLTIYDTVVLALLPNLSKNLAHYAAFAHASYQFIEFDAERSYIFAIALGDEVGKIVPNVTETPKLLLYKDRQYRKRNSHFEKFNSADWQTNRIIIWLQASFKQQFSRLYAYNSPKTMALQVRQQPVLSILVPGSRNGYFKIIDQPNQLEVTATRVSSVMTHKCYVPKNYLNRCPKLSLMYAFMSGRTRECQMRDFGAFNLLNVNARRLKWQRHNLRIAIAKYLRKSIDLVKVELTLNQSLSNDNSYHFDYYNSDAYNKTLGVMIIDVDKHADIFSQHDIKPKGNMTSIAYIVDSHQESIYVMSGTFSFQGILQFVKDYYTNALVRHARTSTTVSILHPHKKELQQNKDYKDYVRDINGENLMDMLTSNNNNNDRNVTIVILMYASHCALCAIMLQPLLQLSSMLTNSKDNAINIEFVRINTQLNSLPWQFNVPRTPSLLIFPHQLKGDSLVFPNNLEANWHNIFAFILAQLQPIEQMHLVLTVCNSKIMSSMRLQNCLQFAQSLVVKHIAHHLKYWQMHHHKRPQLLEHLYIFKNLYMTTQQKLRIYQ